MSSEQERMNQTIKYCHDSMRANEVVAKVTKGLSLGSGALGLCGIAVALQGTERTLGMILACAGSAGYILYDHVARQQTDWAIEDMTRLGDYERRIEEL